MFVGALEADLLLPATTSSLKDKRSYVRPVVAELQRRFHVACGEVGDADLRGRVVIGVAAVGGEARIVGDVLDACERLLAGRPELELLSVRRRLWGVDD